MKKIYISIFFMICFIGSAGAQSPYPYADEVMQRITAVINRDMPEPPYLVWSHSVRGPAVTHIDGRIELDAKLPGLLRRFGADSINVLAHILSHEAMHYYLEHFWAGRFALPYADAAWSKELQGIQSDTLQLQLQETQADIYAIFYSTAAGYNTLHVADALLDSIYTWYKLPDKMETYPSLSHRKEMAQSAAREVVDLLPFFEAGNLMLQIGMYQGGNEQLTYLTGAALAYQHIISKNIHTAEMYNNMAVVKMVQAVAHLNDTLSSVLWPFVVENGSVLHDAAATRAAVSPLPAEALRLLQEARGLLEEAMELDPAYIPGLTNLCLAHLLLNKSGAYADTYDALSQLPTNSWILAELDALQLLVKNNPEAEKAFEASLLLGSPTAAVNRKLAAGNFVQKAAVLPALPDIKEQIEQQPLPDFFAGVSAMEGKRSEERSQQLLLFTDTLFQYQVFEIKFRFTNKAFRTLKMVKTLPGTTPAQSRGLYRGMPLPQMQSLYPGLTKTLKEPQHTIYYDPAAFILIWVDNQQQVTDWAYFWAM